VSDLKAEDIAIEDTTPESAETTAIGVDVLDTMSGGHAPPPVVE